MYIVIIVHALVLCDIGLFVPSHYTEYIPGV